MWRQPPHWPCHSLLRPERGPRSPEGRLTSPGLSYGLMRAEAPKGAPTLALCFQLVCMRWPLLVLPALPVCPEGFSGQPWKRMWASVGLSKESAAASLSSGGAGCILHFSFPETRWLSVSALIIVPGLHWVRLQTAGGLSADHTVSTQRSSAGKLRWDPGL